MDRYYTLENVQNEPYYRLPKSLFNSKYKSLSSDARILYTILRDRVTLSQENNWVDDLGRIFVYMTIEEIQDNLNCSNRLAIATLKSLIDLDLIEKVRQGLRKPNKIYVKCPEVTESHFLKCKNVISRSDEKSFLEVTKSHSIKTNNIKTNIINIRDDENHPLISRCCKEYIEKINISPSNIEIEKLSSWLDEVEEDLIIEAINIAALNGVSRYNYIDTILNNWINDGIKTLEQFKAEKEIRKQKRDSNNERRTDEKICDNPELAKRIRGTVL